MGISVLFIFIDQPFNPNQSILAEGQQMPNSLMQMQIQKNNIVSLVSYNFRPDGRKPLPKVLAHLLLYL